MVVPRSIRESLYKALVLPVVEYGSVLYDNCSTFLKQRLERLHRNASVIVTGAFKNTSYVKLLEELGWDSLEDRRKLSRLCLFKKMELSKKHIMKISLTISLCNPIYLIWCQEQWVTGRGMF